MQTQTLFSLSGLAVLTVCSVSGVQAQSPQAIMKKVQANYNTAKTYQSVQRVQMSLGQMVFPLNIVIKAIPNKKMAVTTTPAPAAPGVAQSPFSAAMNQKVVDDGKNFYIYMAALNKYMKRPHIAGGGQAGMMGGFTPGDFKNDAGTFKMLAPTTIGVHPVYVIAYSPPLNPQHPGASMKMVIYVDKVEYRVRRLTMTGASMNMPINMTMNIVSEKYNAPIPADVFRFTPPPGAQEMQGLPGMGGGLGMTPGR